ncbi:MAG: OmpH family outer membrane protein [Bacteroidota bacterium]|nr:OmpH family outer membrane protein [Bacteroidota bacterium]
MKLNIMNVRILTCLGILCLFISSAICQKVGHLNSSKFLDTLPESKQIATQLQTYEKALSTTGEEMISKFQNNLRKYQQEKQLGNLTPIQQQQMESDLTIEQDAIGKYQQSAQQSLNKRREELLKPLLDSINTALKELAKAEGFLFIFDSSVSLLYMNDALDVTPLLLKKLGK